MELELNSWKQKFEQEKLVHEKDVARINDLIVKEANTEALKGLAVALTLSTMAFLSTINAV